MAVSLPVLVATMVYLHDVADHQRAAVQVDERLLRGAEVGLVGRDRGGKGADHVGVADARGLDGGRGLSGATKRRDVDDVEIEARSCWPRAVHLRQICRRR